MKDFYDEEVYECDGNCDCCEFDDLEEQLEAELIGEAINKILEVAPCPHCIAETLFELAYKFKDIGWQNHQDYIREINED